MATPVEEGAPPFLRRTLPLLAGYWSFGQFWGFWVILVYEFQRAHGLTDARLGVLYSLGSISGIVSMLVLAPRLQSIPMRTSVPLSLASFSVGAFLLAALPTSLLVVTFLFGGLGNGLIDVYLNVAAQHEESRSGRPVLQWLHASYALGGVTGASAAGVLRSVGIDHRVGLAIAGLALLATAVWNRGASTEPAARDAVSSFSISALVRHPVLWIPAIVVLFAFLIEGSMDIWSGLFLREELGATAGAAAATFVAFAGSLFIGRLFAARVLFGLGSRRTILIGGLGAMIGAVVVVLAGSTAIVAAAFLVLGFSISAVGPAAFGLVQQSDADPAEAIAAVATIGYTGFVWSPPLLGWIAGAVSLRAAMGVIAIATVGILLTGAFARGGSREP